MVRIDILRKSFALLDPTRRWKWLLLIGLAFLAGTLEAVGAVLIFILLQAITDPKSVTDLPVASSITDYFPELSDETILTYTALVIAAFFLLRGVVLIFQTYLINRVTSNSGVSIAARLLILYLEAPYEFHLQRNSTSLIRNAMQSCELMAAGLFTGMLFAFSEVLILVSLLLVLVLATSPGTLLGAASLAAVALLILRALRPQVSALGRRQQELVGDNLGALQQALHGLREVKLWGAANLFSERFREKRAELSRAQYLNMTLTSIPRVILETVLVVGLVVFLLLTLTSEPNADTLVSSIGILAYATLRILPSFGRLVTFTNSMEFAKGALDDVYADFTALSALQGEETEAPAELTFERRIIFENVAYTYPGAGESAVHDISFEIVKGEAIGIVGRTGAGKSTILDLFLGLIPPSQGRILIDDAPLQGHESAWQTRLGVVPQTIYLLDETLASNIAFGTEEIDEACLARVSEIAQLKEFVGSLPEGTATVLGERGIRLSGGQRQRIAIARALYRDPEVLIFDEGTASLDRATEQALVEAIERSRGRATTIIVTHRLNTVAYCDRIFLMDQGRMIDAGTFDELMARSETFKTLAG